MTNIKCNCFKHLQKVLVTLFCHFTERNVATKFELFIFIRVSENFKENAHFGQPRPQGFSLKNGWGGKRPWYRLVTYLSYTLKSWV